MGIVSQREKETHARIQTQRNLKDAAKMLKVMENEIDKFFFNRLKRSMSQKRAIIMAETLGDAMTKGRLISKSIVRGGSRTSKQRIFTWLFLQRDEYNPFEHFEEKCFSVSSLMFHTKKICDPVEFNTGVYLTRHCLERVYERIENLTTLESTLKILSPYISALLYSQDDCDAMAENDTFILVSNTSYLVVKSQLKEDSYSERDYVITTFLPIELWSKKRKETLTPIVDSFNILNESPDEIDTKLIAVIKPSLIEKPLDRPLTFDDIRLIRGFL